MSDNELFDIVHEGCGHGMHSIVSVVKRRSDEELLIWKRPISNSHIHQEAFKKEFKKSKFWRKHGLSKVEVQWHPDGKSLLKTFIKGPTLKEALRKDHHFFSNTESKKFKELKKLFRLLVKAKHYIGDISPKNLAWDGNEWQIFDSSSVRGKENKSSLKQRYKEKIVTKWATGLSSDLKWGSEEIHSIESFADSI